MFCQLPNLIVELEITFLSHNSPYLYSHIPPRFRPLILSFPRSSTSSNPTSLHLSHTQEWLYPRSHLAKSSTSTIKKKTGFPLPISFFLTPPKPILFHHDCQSLQSSVLCQSIIPDVTFFPYQSQTFI